MDWIVATGANLYHDMHHAMNLPLFRGSPFVRDPELRKVGVVRIYDILLDYNDVLMQTDHILRQILLQPEFQKEMGTAELHYLLGKYCAEFEKQTGLQGRLGAGGGVPRGRAVLLPRRRATRPSA